MIKSLLILCCILSFLFLLVGFFHPVTAINGDLGYYLKIGEIIFQTKTVPTTNLFSYTYPDFPFINPNWLSEVVFYLIFQYAGGFNGLLIITSLITLLSFSLLFRFAAKNYSLAASVIATVLSVPIIVSRNDIRPEIFSMLFVSLFITILYQYRLRFTKWIYVLIPLQIIWVNMHIYFIIGILLIAFFLLESLLIRKNRSSRTVKTLGIVLTLASVGTMINPNGLNGALFPFTVFQNYGLPIIENQNLFTIHTQFRQTQAVYGISIIGLLFLLLILTRRNTKPVDLFIVLFFSCAAFFALRNLPLFIYTGFIALAAALNTILPLFAALLQKYTSKSYTLLITHISLVICMFLLLIAITKVSTVQGLGFGVDERARMATDFYINNNLQGPLYNNYDIGSYLAFRLYPKKVFVDGRPEAYPREFFEKIYIPMQQSSAAFAKANGIYKFNTLFISHWDQTPNKNVVLTSLLNSPDYALVYLDDYALIFVKRDSAHKDFLHTYEITEETFLLEGYITQNALLRYLYFFKKAGWTKQEKHVSQIMIKRSR